MANVVTTQILEDGERNAIVKITGTLDTANLTNQLIVDCATLTQGGTAPRPAQVRVDHLDYSISDPLELQLMWDGAPAVPMLPLAGRGRMSFWNFGGLQNNATTGKTGNITLSTTGWASGTQIFSLVLELVKQ
mgnify:FL=1|jgi:hypothetical protein